MSAKKIVLLFILGLLVRILVLNYLPNTNHLKSDDFGYDLTACNILNGHGFSTAESPPYAPTNIRTPVYSIFLAAIYGIFGHNYNVVFIIQILLSALTALLIYFIAFESFVSHQRQIASLSYILVLFCPFLWFFARMLFTETLVTFWVTLSVLFIILALKKGSYWLFFSSGLIMGLALLTRPAVVLLPISLIFLIMLAKEKRDKFSSLAKKCGICMFGVMLIWSPWIIRNYIIYNEFVPLTGGVSGQYLYMGTFSFNKNSPDYIWNRKEEVERFDYYLSKGNNYKEFLALDKQSKREAFKRIKDKPLTYLKYSVERIPILWLSSFSQWFNFETPLRQLIGEFREKISEKQDFTKELKFILIKLFLSFINFLYVSTAVVGMALLSRHWRKYYPLLMVPLYFTLAHMFLGMATTRYTVPALPILLIFSACGLLFLGERLKFVFIRKRG